MDRVRLAQTRLREALPDWTDPAFEVYAARHNPAYWLKVDTPRQSKHARLVRETEDAGRTVTTSFETDAFRGVTELTVLAPDHPRLLAIVTGACAASGGNIVDAQIFTTVDGTALDTIFLSRAFDRDEDELRRAERVARSIESALKGEVRIADLVDGKRPAKERPKPFQVAPEVVIDNALSTRHTVLEVTGLDRPGLLYDLTTALGKLNLNIASAHIATFGEKAVDVFYVTDLTGTKVTHPGRQGAIRRALLEIFEGESAAESPLRAAGRGA
jgi:[protein-PII] uridylyltransferase